MQWLARRFDTGQAVRVDAAEGKIVQVVPVTDQPSDDWPWIAPGLIDIQVNGYGGQEFCSADLTPQKVEQMVWTFCRQGATRVCPTVTTESFTLICHALEVIRKTCESSSTVARRVPGIHLEGPYLSAEDGCRGAHPRAHCRAPDWDEFQRFQEAADGRIRIVTLAPEYESAPAFISRAVDSGVIVSIGHTAANTDHIRAAADAGARLSTHLGNGAQPMIRRHPNYIWAQLAEDRLVASLIVDGHHLPAEVVKAFVRAKGLSRCILVSDMSGLAGLAPGRHVGNLCEVEILPDGRIVVAGQRQILAGASRPLAAGIGNVMHFAGVDLGQAIRMATDHPAQLLGIKADTLQPGDRGDFILFDLVAGENPEGPQQVLVRKVVVDGAETSALD